MIFDAFNFVNKKLKKVILPLFILQKYSYLCRMNYSKGQYCTCITSFEQLQCQEVFGAVGVRSVVCALEDNRAFSAHIEGVVCLECRNA